MIGDLGQAEEEEEEEEEGVSVHTELSAMNLKLSVEEVGDRVEEDAEVDIVVALDVSNEYPVSILPFKLSEIKKRKNVWRGRL